MNLVGGTDILLSTALDSESIKSNIMPFYKGILDAWAKWTFEDLEEFSLARQFLYFNKNILKPNKQCLLPTNLSEKGIHFIGDLLDDNNQLITFTQAKSKYKLSWNDLIKFSSIRSCVQRILPPLLRLQQPILRDNLKTKLSTQTSKTVSSFALILPF